MSEMKRYEPSSVLNQLLNNFYGPLGKDLGDEESNIVTSHWMPSVDIKEEDDKFLIYADVPGVDPKDIDVTMENGILTIKGERESESREEKGGYKRVERSKGSFYRRFSLPDSADADNINAKSNNGVLEITIPKHEVVIPRKITVKS